MAKPSLDSVAKKLFRHAVWFSELLLKVLKTGLIGREGGFLPPSLFPRYSVVEVYFIVF